jgi:hypothetical protein
MMKHREAIRNFVDEQVRQAGQDEASIGHGTMGVRVMAETEEAALAKVR